MKTVSNVIDFSIVGKTKRLVKRHLAVFKAAAEAYVADKRGIAFMPSEHLSEEMFLRVGAVGEMTNAVRLVVEAILFNMIIKHRDTHSITGTEMSDSELWYRIAQSTMISLSSASPEPNLFKADFELVTAVQRPDITEIPLYKTIWTLQFDEFKSTVVFAIMGYIKPMGSVNLGITFVSNENLLKG
jgi:hypothetical protein